MVETTVDSDEILRAGSGVVRCLGPRTQDPQEVVRRLRSTGVDRWRPAVKIKRTSEDREYAARLVEVVARILGRTATIDRIVTILWRAEQGRAAGTVQKWSNDGCYEPDEEHKSRGPGHTRGYDLRQLYMLHPFDGKPKEALCPQCGRTVRWRPRDLEE